jgi:hypothetical protein
VALNCILRPDTKLLLMDRMRRQDDGTCDRVLDEEAHGNRISPDEPDFTR